MWLAECCRHHRPVGGGRWPYSVSVLCFTTSSTHGRSYVWSMFGWHSDRCRGGGYWCRWRLFLVHPIRPYLADLPITSIPNHPAQLERRRRKQTKSGFDPLPRSLPGGTGTLDAVIIHRPGLLRVYKAITTLPLPPHPFLTHIAYFPSSPRRRFFKRSRSPTQICMHPRFPGAESPGTEWSKDGRASSDHL